ncbi:hypothetical protein Adt_16084 [Abeliophyllum distichum]|uniref:Glycine zipper 2TM domain-containing protein n=1 Tax=Abeliophyllum distichum TaxID=126358 RepID=A0ABD1TCN6_9LAMI
MMRVQLLSLAGVLVLSFTAEKCRQLVGEEHSSRSRTERFTFTDCFDMRYGTIACVFKEIIKLYLYYIRAVHVQKVRGEVSEKALMDNLSKGRNIDQAVKVAHEEGKKAAKRASRQAKHVMGPIVASGWDFFETLYVGGSLAEGLVRSGGTFVGTFTGGLVGEGKIGWFGFVLGSQMGSWVGGRIGLMAYDVGIGAQYLLHRIPFLS